jgi:hypothetical protein
MTRRIRTILCFGLAVLNVSLSVGNPTGFVLCVGDDGSMAIESPASQAACATCQQRHEAPGSQQPDQTGARIGAAAGCTDIPLSLAPGAVLHRSRLAARPLAGRAETSVTWFSVGAHRLTYLALAPTTGANRLTPPSSALTALRTVVLLI